MHFQYNNKLKAYQLQELTVERLKYKIALFKAHTTAADPRITLQVCMQQDISSAILLEPFTDSSVLLCLN